MMKKKAPLSTLSTSPTAAAANSSAIAAPTADDIKLISKMANNEELDIFGGLEGFAPGSSLIYCAIENT